MYNTNFISFSIDEVFRFLIPSKICVCVNIYTALSPFVSIKDGVRTFESGGQLYYWLSATVSISDSATT